MKYFLDTDICIYIIKNNPPGGRSKFKKHKVGDIGISAITYAELQFGVANSSAIKKNTAAVAHFIRFLPVVPYDMAAALEYGRIYADLKKRGEIIGANDLHIAAHACALNCTLVTNNVREFTRVQDLKVENWT